MLKCELKDEEKASKPGPVANSLLKTEVPNFNRFPQLIVENLSVILVLSRTPTLLPSFYRLRITRSCLAKLKKVYISYKLEISRGLISIVVTEFSLKSQLKYYL